MIENVNYAGSEFARPEPSSDLTPTPALRSAVSVVDDRTDPVGVAILQELAEIKREVRALRARDIAQNTAAVPLESAMAMLGCKRSQIFKLLARGRLERAPKVGRSAMITVASIEALLAEGVPPKGGTRSCRSAQQPELINAQVRTRRRESNTGSTQQDPGVAIRKLRL